MKKQENQDINEKNQDAFDDLIVSIEAGVGKLSLLIATCEDSKFRDEIIARYESELEPNFRSYHVTLPRGEPSLKMAISQVVETEEYLQQNQPAVITVTGTEQLFFLKFGEAQSEQDKFFGYLQWTREGMREYPFAIVIWVTNNLLQNLQKKAPDFWSWRTGVFRFYCITKNTVAPRDLEHFRSFINDSRLETADDDNEYFLPLEDLQRLIREIETQPGINEATLASLYTQLGQIYDSRLEKGESQSYQNELDLAIGYFQKAVELQQKLGLELELATSLDNLAFLYDSQGKYEAAEPLFLQALELRKSILGENHPDYATSLNNLAFLYHSQGKYTEAEPLFLQALELRKSILGENHPDYADSLNNVAALYRSQGKYEAAEPLYLQALRLTKSILGENHPDYASSLINLAFLYKSQGKYVSAEALYLQGLELIKSILGKNNPNYAVSLNNLAELYRFQGKYEAAEPLYIEALELTKFILGENHRYYASILNNLALLYNYQGKYKAAEPLFIQALELRKSILGENHPDYASSLNNLAFLYDSQGKYDRAEPLYLQALEIRDRTWGSNHPNTVSTRENLENLRIQQRENRDNS
jgi:tetratricopeptide (TPR) repeat protein